MYKYTIQAYNLVAGSPVNIVNVIVTAATEQAAIQEAGRVVPRTNFSVISIEVLSAGMPLKKQPTFKKG